jgi:hypothetical protein
MSDFGFDPQSRAEFGDSLAAGDFNGDGATDLAIGIPSQDFGLPGDNEDAGEVGVIFATLGVGLSTASLGSTQLLTEVQFVASIGGPATIARPAPHNFFGDSLAAGDFNGDGRDDLAIGTPNEDFSPSVTDVGAVFVAYGSRRQLNITLKQGWNRNTLFGAGSVEDSDIFGFSLAAGDFDGDGRDDLAVGVPFRDLHSVRNGTVITVVDAGEVNVIYGSAAGLSTLGRAPQNWTQDSPSVLDSAQAFDKFGFSLSAWNFGRNQFIFVGPGQPPRVLTTADLAIGVPLEDIGAVGNAGAVNIIYGSSSGLNAGIGNQFWTAGSPGIPSTIQQGAAFGTAMY